MNRIEQLEQEIQDIKKNELYKDWEIYSIKAEKFLQSLVGKVVARRYRGLNGFTMMKITGIKKINHIKPTIFGLGILVEEPGDMGRCHYEIITEGYFDLGLSAWSEPSCIYYEFIKAPKKRKKDLNVFPLKFKSKTISTDLWQMKSKKALFGEKSFYDNKPDVKRDIEDFLSMMFEIDIEMYNDAIEVNKVIIQKNIEFLEKHDEGFKNMKSIEYSEEN